MVKKSFPYLFLMGMLAVSCVNDLKTVEELNATETGVEVAKDVETFYYGPGGRLKGRLTAPLLHRYMLDTPVVELNHGLRVDFYNDSLQLQSILTAKKGRYWENSNDIIVSDSVVVRNREGKRLDCEELHWDPKKQQFFTDKPALVTTADRTFYGANGLVANQDFTWYELRNLKGTMIMDSTFLAPPADSTATADTTPAAPVP